MNDNISDSSNVSRRCESCGGTVCRAPGCAATERALARVLAASRCRYQEMLRSYK